MPDSMTAPTGLVCTKLAEGLCVRNTFIDLDRPLHFSSAHRRSCSAPIILMPDVSVKSTTKKPSLSAVPPLVLSFSKPDGTSSIDGCSEATEDMFETCNFEDVLSTPVSSLRWQTSFTSACSWQDGSARPSEGSESPCSDPHSKAAIDGCSEAAEDRFYTCSSEDVPNTPVSTPRWQTSLSSVCSFQGGDDSARPPAGCKSPPSPSLVRWHSFPVECLTGCCDSRLGSTGLNSKARPWQPALAAPQPPEKTPPTDFVEAVGAMVQSFEQKVEHFVRVPIAVHVIRERRIWSIICRIREEDMDYQDTILYHAKQHILCSAEACDAFHLLGCHLDPFKPKQRGFGVDLAPILDKSLACWDFYATGNCARGSKCRWQHPLFRQRLNVLVKALVEMPNHSPTAATQLGDDAKESNTSAWQ
mmetsp:Transcript_16710/g.32696  ORF Transcript_16710/g.32696 Transcript_16710/m.32696 type:complete len:416 (-) Transcript_16710:124-1371(-)